MGKKFSKESGEKEENASHRELPISKIFPLN
jgi:hypothetical protein